MKRKFAALILALLVLTPSAWGMTLTLDGQRVDIGETVVQDNTTFVSRHTVSRLLGGAADGEDTLVPLRPLCASLGVYVAWDPFTGDIALTSPRAVEGLAGDDLYWLAHIISAESAGQSWEGKIAVGNVVLNRVASADFPDSVYEVIFDDRWGGQFEPARNGTVFWEPTAESVLAAAACLRGTSVMGDALYFLAPDLTSNHWTMENREYVATIGAHWFYR